MSGVCAGQPRFPGGTMSVNALSQANGADLLQRFSESTGKAPANPAQDATPAALKTAVAVTKLNEASAAGSGDSGSNGSLLNVLA